MDTDAPAAVGVFSGEVTVAERLEIRVTGIVQGVAFRWYTRERAGELGLVGWVRNLPDGSVQLLAEGPREDLERLLLWCGQGPPSARIRKLAPRWTAATGEFDDFRITG